MAASRHRRRSWQPLWAIAALTWKAAFRFRIFWVLTVLLLGSVVALPLLLKDDGSARGFTQILLTYTLSVITALLGLATLWISCGLLAREVEDCQLQVVASKPVARWQIWVGKWLGILSLNAALLTLSGASVFCLLQWRAGRLPAAQQEILRNQVFVARGSLREPAPDIDAEVERIYKERVNESSLQNISNPQFLKDQIREWVQARLQVVQPNTLRRWTLNLGLRQASLKDQPLYVRLKFHAAKESPTGTYAVVLVVGPPGSPNRIAQPMKLSASSFHEIEIPPNMIDQDGVLTVDLENRDNVSLLFPLDEGFEVLYREGGFALNFGRGLFIIFCWLALLAALGLASASYMSFPVAAFFALSLMVVVLCSGTLSTVVQEGTIMGLSHETGAASHSPLDYVLIPLFKVILKVVNLVRNFSPVDSLSTGRSITWGQIAAAFFQVVVLMGGVIALAGIYLFNRRELATAQGNA